MSNWKRGNDIKIYLQGIGAVLKDKDNQVVSTEYYYTAINNFKIDYYSFNNSTGEYEIILNKETKKSGQYKVGIEYGTEEPSEEGPTANYYGKGEYYFSIVPAPYSGTVTL